MVDNYTSSSCNQYFEEYYFEEYGFFLAAVIMSLAVAGYFGLSLFHKGRETEQRGKVFTMTADS